MSRRRSPMLDLVTEFVAEESRLGHTPIRVDHAVTMLADELTEHQVHNGLARAVKCGRLIRVTRGVYDVPPVQSDVTIAGVTLESIRTHFDVAGKAWFCLRDLMNFLGMSENSRVTDITRGLTSDEVRVVPVHSSAGRREATFVTISGVFFVCGRARSEEGRALALWARKTAEAVVEGRNVPQPASTELSVPSDPMALLLENALAERKRMTAMVVQHEHTVSRVEAIERHQERVSNALARIHDRPPSVLVPAKTTRASLELLMRDVGASIKEEGTWSTAMRTAWRKLYSEFYARFRIDLQRRADNLKVSKVEAAEQLGYIEHLYGLAVELFYYVRDLPTAAQRTQEDL